MTDHDAIAARVRQNRETGTPGPWKIGKNNPARVSREGRYIANFDPLHSNDPKCEDDARRAARLPDLEAAYLDLYDEVKRLRAFMRMIVDDRDRTFVLLAERAEEAEAERDRLRAALTIYAQSGNWRLGGCCDPNSPNFTGEAIAREALKGPEE